MPASTPGDGADRDQRQSRRLEIGRQEHEDHEHGDPQSDPQRLEHLDHRRELAHGLDPDAVGAASPAAAMAWATWREARPMSSPSTFAVRVR